MTGPASEGTPPPESPPPASPQGSWQTEPQSTWQPPQAAPVAAGPAPGVAYADLVQRVIAYIIDAIIFGIVFWVIGIALLGGLLLTGGFAGAIVGFLVLSVLSLVGSAIYFVYTWMTMRASPGQRILGLETVNEADGATLTRDQAIRRWAFLFGPQAVGAVAQTALGGDAYFLGLIISLATLGYTIYLLYTASQSPKRQGFHDVQANTVVVARSRA